MTTTTKTTTFTTHTTSTNSFTSQRHLANHSLSRPRSIRLSPLLLLVILALLLADSTTDVRALSIRSHAPFLGIVQGASSNTVGETTTTTIIRQSTDRGQEKEQNQSMQVQQDIDDESQAQSSDSSSSGSKTKDPKQLLKANTRQYSLLLAGYNGAATPYTFTPPSSLIVAGNTLNNGKSGDQPSWASFSKTQPIAYVTGENQPGRVYAVNITQKQYRKPEFAQRTLALTVLGGGGELGGALTGGDGPVASCIAKRILFIANYGSGSASALQLDTEGRILESEPSFVVNYTRTPEGSIGPVTSRQDHSYAHQVAADPSHRWVYVPDLGADRVHRLSIPDSRKASDVRPIGSTVVAEGSGPRHIAFYRRKAGSDIYAYLASELLTTLTAFKVRDSDGHLQMISTPQSALPAGVDGDYTKQDGNSRTTSEVAVSPDGKFVYVGTRGDPEEDHIAVFKRNTKDGSVKFDNWYPSGGRNLRHFSLSPDSEAMYIAAGHQESGDVRILSRNSRDGSLTKLSAQVEFEQVAFAGFVTGPAADL